jgi:hypothetical protein
VALHDVLAARQCRQAARFQCRPERNLRALALGERVKVRVAQQLARLVLLDGRQQLHVEAVRAEERRAVREEKGRVFSHALGDGGGRRQHEVRVVRRTQVAVHRAGDDAVAASVDDRGVVALAGRVERVGESGGVVGVASPVVDLRRHHDAGAARCRGRRKEQVVVGVGRSVVGGSVGVDRYRDEQHRGCQEQESGFPDGR